MNTIRGKSLFRLFLMLSLFAGHWSGLADELVYVRKASREATKEASIKATVARLAPFKYGAWNVLGKTPRRDDLTWDADGKIDLLAVEKGAQGEAMKWALLPLWKDGEWLDVDESQQWFYRTVESDRDTKATFTLGANVLIKVYFNGIDVNTFATTMEMEGKVAHFTVDLHKGINHVLIWMGASPSKLYHELSSFNADMLADLENRLETDFPNEGEQRYYRLETVKVPAEIVLEVGGMAVAQDGRIMIATRRGEIWAYAPKGNKWDLFASGLHEPLGLVAGKPGEYFLLQRPELTRVADTDGDGKADTFETITAEWGLSGGHHEYIFGPVRDSKGNFWGVISGLADKKVARWSGWCFKVTPQGEFIPWSRGFRSSNGIGVTPDDEVFVAENQGEYVGTSMIHHVTKGAFHGHPIGLLWDKSYDHDPYKAPIEELESMRKLPAILMPYGPMGQSTSQPLTDTTGGKFGPFAGQMFVADQSKAIVMRVAMEKVGGEFQGAAFPFRRGFQSGNNRLLFAPDGSLYVGQTDRGWGSVGGRPYGLQRVVWSGEVPLEVKTMTLLKNGFELTFTKPVNVTVAANPATYALRHYFYEYHARYGAAQEGITSVPVKAAKVSVDGLKVTLEVPELVTRRLYELNISGLRAGDGSELLHPTAYYTLNRLK